MGKNKVIVVQNINITVSEENFDDYICITDIAKAKVGESRGADVVKNWMRNRATLEFLGTWEQIYNPAFKVVEFDHFKSEAGLHTFVLSVSEWIEKTEAIGLFVKRGKYGGTYAHKDIAFEFASAISPVFKLYLIKEFQRLKEDENDAEKIEWDAKRFLSKNNYLIQTDAVKNYLIPSGNYKENLEWLAYAEEADILNVALFGFTAKAWRNENPELAKKNNVRDFASINELTVLLKLVLGYSRGRFQDETEKTSEFDDWGFQFLPILFEGKSIKYFNTAMYLDVLKAQQDDGHYQIVQMRWRAIQAHFSGDIEKCVEYLEEALNLAKETNQPTWIIKDILVDLRNEHWVCCTARNEFSDAPAQKELTESNEELYYPILDRIDESLHEKYIEGLYKKKTESPYSVTLGNNLDQYGEMLASSFIVSMYNGSLTHILLIYEKIRNFVFYLSCKYDDWSFKLNLYKLAIFEGKEKEIKGIQDSYPEILNNLSSEEAASIMDFCLNHPIKHKRLSSQWLAFGAVGYFLDDKCFEHHAKSTVGEIKSWLSSEGSVVSIGQDIFKCLSGVAYRMSQDTLSEICCQFIEKHYRRWYREMFNFIANRIDLRKMSTESAQDLVEHINRLLDSEKEREEINYSPTFLCILRKQNIVLTEDMDQKVAEYFPDYYKGTYKLETTENEKQDMPVFVREYIERIKNNNETQGKNGAYFGHSIREIATVRTILLGKEVVCNAETMDMLISTVADTLLISKEGISIKLDAIALLI